MLKLIEPGKMPLQGGKGANYRGVELMFQFGHMGHGVRDDFRSLMDMICRLETIDMGDFERCLAIAYLAYRLAPDLFCEPGGLATFHPDKTSYGSYAFYDFFDAQSRPFLNPTDLQ